MNDHQRTYSLKIEQKKRQPLMVSISSQGAELESSFHVGGSSVFSTLHAPYMRNVKLYEVLDGVEINRTIHLTLESRAATSDSRAQIDVFELGGTSRETTQLMSAYRSFSSALQSTDSEAPEAWRPRVASLRAAADLFDQLGRPEESLWARLFEAYFHYFPLYDYPEAIRLSMQTHEQADVAGFDKIALGALQVLAFTLIERDEADTPLAAEAKYFEAQRVFDRAAALARRLDMRFAEAWAINGKGIGYFYQEKHEEALAHYEQALGKAMELADVYFTNQIQGNIALAQERLGRDQEALQTLQSIAASFSDSTDRNLVLDNLIEQGRVFKNLNQFSGAIDALSTALALAANIDATNARGRILINLAHAYYEMGLMDRAKELLVDAEPVLRASNNGRSLRELYAVTANIHRLNAEFELMHVARAHQEEFISTGLDRANYLFLRATDLIAQNSDLERAQDYLRESAELAQDTTDVPLQQRLRQELCLNSLRVSHAGDACDFAQLQEDYAGLVDNALPREALAGMEAWANVLARAGRDADALRVFDQLVARIAFYRRNLPGVLGAWYWERRRSIFDAYMRLALKRDITRGEGMDSLLLFDRLRNLGLNDSSDRLANSPLSSEQQARFRSVLARRTRARTATEDESLEREYDQLMLEVGRQNTTGNEAVDRGAFESRLGTLSNSESVLAFYFAGTGVYAWSAGHTGVRLVELPALADPAGQMRAMVSAIRTDDRSGFLSVAREIGTHLLDPVGPLGARIYLLAAGPLNGFPFDLIQLGDEPLGRTHTVINLMSLDSVGDEPGSRLRGERLFLAGDPIGMPDGSSQLHAAGAELDFVAGLYPSARITEARRLGLTLEAFRTAEFTQSDLVHIASHARVDLDYPSLSTITLSGDSLTAANYLTPVDIEGARIAAGLVVLSACETSGSSQFSYDGNLGFVTAFLSAGANSVVASLWPVPDRDTAAFMRDFYTHLASGLSAQAALFAAKRVWMERDRSDQAVVWAAFQIYQN